MTQTREAPVAAPVLVLPGGFADRPPGLAALGALLLRLLLARDTPHARVVVAPHTVHVHGVGEPGTVVAALKTAHPDERLLASLRRALNSSAQAALADPGEVMVHGLERAGWGDSRHGAYWGDGAGRAAGAIDGSVRDLNGLLGEWAGGVRVGEVAEGSFVIRRWGQRPWTASTVAAPADGARLLVGLAVPLSGPHAQARASAAAAVLGTPQLGRLATRLRHQRALCYGSMAVPLVRAGRTALIAAVSTTAPYAQECARQLASEVRALTTERADRETAVDTLGRIRLDRTVALARARAGLEVDALGRGWLETTFTSDGLDGPDGPDGLESTLFPLAVAGRPAWFLHGPVPEGMPDLTEEIW
ncbi:hypothetical protein PV682_41200 [Streptomyces niveiscabiei]|uniref:hypothetical protein n=1 Tax=Streptomyces niveiscabiei TaxID=164115 RepID=UPI0029B214F1|nr:hypothetical protein [Streptomyces niveiscabiei]MDX3387816.1 hypothetical protein [Streptomyces niveiscabiei]